MNGIAGIFKIIAITGWMGIFIGTDKKKECFGQTALWIVSALALAANIAVLDYEIYKIIKTKRNPLKEELYPELAAYQQVAKLR